MFVPDIYRAPDPAWLVEQVRAFPLGLLVTPGAAGLLATHLPVVFAADVDGTKPPGALDGATLCGHLNRANPHWTALADGADALLVFQGADGYVSPTAYQTTPAAPTWDFVAVHVRGALRPVVDAERTRQVVRTTARVFEGRFGAHWDMTSSLDYFERLLPGVGAFEVVVARAEGMFKLSQEKKPEVRERVAAAFARSGDSRRQEVAALIERTAQAESGVAQA